MYICVECFQLGIEATVAVKQSAIPKLYYSIREVSELFDEEQHILRHWEREIPLLRPNKNRAGNRVYVERDLRVLRVLKVLIREQRKTLAEVRQLLADGIPAELEPIANDTTIEQRYGQKRQSATIDAALSAADETVVLPRTEAERLLETLKRIEELLGDSV